MAESAIAIALAFLVGAFPTAYLTGRVLGGGDIREFGSGNPGALNVYRRFGKWAALLVLGVDTGKGALVVFVGQRLGVPDFPLYTAALVATLGHNFSPFLRFTGGKGAATVLGVSAIMLWHITAVSAGFGILMVVATRHVVWSITGVFVLLNALTIGTSQPVGQIALCLALSAVVGGTQVVGGTHLLRERRQIEPAVREGRWRRFMTIE